jgi:hypothetical protein
VAPAVAIIAEAVRLPPAAPQSQVGVDRAERRRAMAGAGAGGARGVRRERVHPASATSTRRYRYITENGGGYQNIQNMDFRSAKRGSDAAAASFGMKGKRESSHMGFPQKNGGDVYMYVDMERD